MATRAFPPEYVEARLNAINSPTRFFAEMLGKREEAGRRCLEELCP